MKAEAALRVRPAVLVGLLICGVLSLGSLLAADRAWAGDLAGAGPLTPPAPLNMSAPAVQPAGATPAPAPADLYVQTFRPAFRVARGAPPPAPAEGGPAKTDLHASALIPPPLSHPAVDLGSVITTMDWTDVFSDDFDTFFFPTTFTTPWVTGTYGLTSDAQWKDMASAGHAYSGSWAVWPAWQVGTSITDTTQGYPNNVNSWMVQGPFDFSNKTDVYVGFNLWYETEPSYDWLYLCVSVDGLYYDCNNYWSGSSGGWTNQSFWLTSYAGYPSVYIAWVFYSDYSIGGDYGYTGPFVDDVYIWDYTPVAAPPPDPRGQLIQNPSFEAGLAPWDNVSTAGLVSAASGPDRPLADGLTISPQSVAVTDTTWVEGAHSAWLGRNSDGADYLFQPFFISNTATALTLNYWYAVTTLETNARSDFFCASLRVDTGSGPSGNVAVDLGCVDAVSATGYWQEVLFDLTPAQLAAIKDQYVYVMFELYNTTGAGQPNLNSWGFVDYVWAYVTDSGLNNSLDPHEPNNSAAEASPDLTCASAITDGVIGDALGSSDEDWYALTAPAGLLTLDIDARTHIPASTLDSVVYLYDGALNLVAYSDDDGATYDSFLTYNVPAGGTYYAVVRSYTGAGSADYTYDLTATCGTAVAPPTGTNVAPPAANTWTVMLYLNAEDPNFESILQGYLTALQNVVAGKQGFLNITALYDGPGTNDTTRYLIQANGSYTNGVNRWPLAEANMGDAATLTDFVNWSMDLYPAENYYLAIDDHGDGIYGMSVDDTSNNDQLTPAEIYSALKDATHNGDRKLSLFDYEACLMGLAENAYDLRQWTDYVVFSQQISWGITTYPAYFTDLAAADTPRTVGERIVARYAAGALGAQYPHTISLIDTSQMGAVRSASDALAAALTARTPSEVAQARSATQAFAASLQQATNPDFAEYLDLADLATQAQLRGLVSAQVAGAVQAAVDQAVVAERHASGGVRVGNTVFNWNHERAHGLSIYYPTDKGSSGFAAYVLAAPQLYQMSADGGWDEFLNARVPNLGGVGNGRGGMSSFRTQDRLLGGQTFLNLKLFLPLVRR